VPLKYFDKLWRYRISDYRLVYAVYPEQQVVQLLAVGPRGEIYKRINYHPEDPEPTDFSALLEQALDPDQETPPEWIKYLLQGDQRLDRSPTLPYHLTPERLTEWRIPEDAQERFIGCETEDALLNCGAPSQHVERVIDCLWPPPIEKIVDQPNYVVEHSKDLTRYAEGDLIGFLLKLDKDQERFVDWALRGPTLIKGGPGSGKSTVALYRIKNLLRRAELEGRKPSVLFTTYTNALVEFSKQLMDRLLEDIDSKVEISTFDKIAVGIVRENIGNFKIASDNDLRAALTSAKAIFQAEGDTELEGMLLRNAIQGIREDYLKEEFRWVIEGQNLQSLQEYLKVDRVGRGYAFDERMRRAVWAIYQHTKQYLKELGPNGKKTWGDVHAEALELIRGNEYKKKWDYILIDEAQDLTPTAISVCVELCMNPEDLFLTADASQSLYNRGFRWKNVHDALQIVGRTRILRRNYRTTRQIAIAASSLMSGTGAGDPEALDQIFVHVGPKPQIFVASKEEELFKSLAEWIRVETRNLKLPLGAAAILAPRNDLAERVADHLNQLGLPTCFMRGRELDLSCQEVKALTIHSGKGLEFPVVAIPFVEDGILPRLLPDNRADDIEKHLDQERRILFVGCTRAMRRLMVTYREENSSTFLSSVDSTLWDISGDD
jgi:superfamily I DNA/RNA helicase